MIAWFNSIGWDQWLILLGIMALAAFFGWLKRKADEQSLHDDAEERNAYQEEDQEG